MPLACFASPKGGVGKTTLAANIGLLLARGRAKVLLVDLDVQNSLRLHFGTPIAERRGFARMVLHNEGWPENLLQRARNLLLLPFGATEPGDAERIERYMADHPGWLLTRLAPFLRDDYIVLVDTPPGPSPFLSQVLPVVDLRLIVLLCDPASLSLLPRIEGGEFFGPAQDERQGRMRYIFNQVDTRRRLTRDVLALIRAQMGPRLLGIGHADEAYAEAAAYQRTVPEHSPHSRAAYDLAAMAAAFETEIAGLPSRLDAALARLPPSLNPARAEP